MGISVARFAQIEPVPWKNGLGRTTQLAIHPLGSSQLDFGWRVSIARLDESAPFSRYEGIERCLAVLQGEMLLTGPAGPTSLTPQSQPLRFSGRDVVHGQVIRGPVLDLNLMWRADRWQARMSRVRWAERAEVSLSPSLLLCSLSEHVDIATVDEVTSMSSFDLLSADAAVDVTLSASAPIDVYLIELIS